MVPLKPRQLLEGPGLRTLLQTEDFGAWDAVVGQALGHHRSRLLPGSVPFAAHIRSGAVEEFTVLHLQGQGQVELLREQCGHGVLWMPWQGLSQETINGQELLAEPGMAMLFRPGDVMQGRTSEAISGVSIVLPEPWGSVSTSGAQSLAPALVHEGPAARRLIDAAWRLVESAALPTAGARFAAEALVDALQQWGEDPEHGAAAERLTASRRRRTVGEACHWMDMHLDERFSVVQLSQALEMSVRNLQYSFQQELGCTPMAHAKRLRLRRLRRLLQDPGLAVRSIAELMEASGLLACGGTAADYRQWCGESPRRTRQLLLD